MSRLSDLIDGRAAALALLVGVLALAASVFSMQEHASLLYGGETAAAKVTKKWQETKRSGWFSRDANLIAYEYADRNGNARSVKECDLSPRLWNGIEEGQTLNVAYDPNNSATSAPVDHLRQSMPAQWIIVSVSFCAFLVGVALAWTKFLDWRHKVALGVA